MRTLGVNALRLVGERTAMGRYLEILAKHWSRLASSFDRIVFIAPLQADLPSIELGTETPVSFVRCGPRVPLALWEQGVLPYVARGAALLFCPCYVAPLLHAGPIVVANHGIYEHIPREFSHWNRLRSSRLQQASVRRASRVIANSMATRGALVRHFGILESQIEVVYPAPAEIYFERQDRSEIAREVLGILGTDAPYILFVGKLSPRRNVPALIEAFARVRTDARLPHRLVIVGPNTGNVPIQSLVAAHGIAPHVIHIPHLDSGRLAPIYAGAELFVLPTVAEGISWTMFEAMASRTPVLTVAHDALREGAGEAVYSVADASVESLSRGLRHLLESGVLRDYYAKVGRDRAEKFSWSDSARRTLTMLEESALEVDGRSPLRF